MQHNHKVFKIKCQSIREKPVSLRITILAAIMVLGNSVCLASTETSSVIPVAKQSKTEVQRLNVFFE
jgi:hypothetical protein